MDRYVVSMILLMGWVVSGASAASFCDITWNRTYVGKIVTSAESVDGTSGATSYLNNDTVTHNVQLRRSGACSEVDGATIMMRATPVSCVQTAGSNTTDCQAAQNSLPYSSYYLQLTLKPNKGASDLVLKPLKQNQNVNCDADCQAAIQHTLTLFARSFDGRFVQANAQKTVYGKGMDTKGNVKQVRFRQNAAFNQEADQSGGHTITKTEYMEALPAKNDSQISAQGSQLFASSQAAAYFSKGTLTFARAVLAVLLPMSQSTDKSGSASSGQGSAGGKTGYSNLRVAIQLSLKAFAPSSSLAPGDPILRVPSSVRNLACDSGLCAYPSAYVEGELQRASMNAQAFRAAQGSFRPTYQQGSAGGDSSTFSSGNGTAFGNGTLSGDPFGDNSTLAATGGRRLMGSWSKQLFGFNEQMRATILGRDYYVAGAAGGAYVSAVTAADGSANAAFDMYINGMVFGQWFSISSLHAGAGFTAGVTAASYISANANIKLGGATVFNRAWSHQVPGGVCGTSLPAANSPAWFKLADPVYIRVWGYRVSFFGLLNVELTAGPSFETRMGLLLCTEDQSAGLGAAVIGSVQAMGAASIGSSSCSRGFSSAGVSATFQLAALNGAYSVRVPLNPLNNNGVCQYTSGELSILRLKFEAWLRAFWKCRAHPRWETSGISVWRADGMKCF